MLEDAVDKGFENIISWQKGGRSFRVHHPEDFAQHVMQEYFQQTKFKSFQRQLNIYGYVSFILVICYETSTGTGQFGMC